MLRRLIPACAPVVATLAAAGIHGEDCGLAW